MTALWTTEQTAAFLSCKASTVRTMIRRGDLPASEIAGRYLVDETDVRDYVQSRRRQVAQPVTRRRRRRAA